MDKEEQQPRASKEQKKIVMLKILKSLRDKEKLEKSLTEKKP